MAIYAFTFSRRSVFFVCVYIWEMGILLHFNIFKFRRLHAQLAHGIYESDLNTCKSSFFLFISLSLFSWRRKIKWKTFCFEECMTMNMITFIRVSFECVNSATDFLSLHLNEIYRWKWSKKSNQCEEATPCHTKSEHLQKRQI